MGHCYRVVVLMWLVSSGGSSLIDNRTDPRISQVSFRTSRLVKPVQKPPAQKSNPPDITMLYRGTTQICVAGSNTNGLGLALMSENIETPFNYTEFEYRTVYNKKLDSEVNCDFENVEHPCGKHWMSNNFQLTRNGGGLLSPIIDDRWNKFEIYLTARGPPKYDKIYDIFHLNFNIGMSIRSSENAQILLCSNPNPRSSPCYWIIIEGLGKQSVTGIRKCVEGVPDKETTQCKTLKHKSDSDKIPGKLLHKSKWAHFSVFKKNNQIQLWSRGINQMTPLLNYTDDEPLNISHMFVRSPDCTAQWKIHKYNFISTNQTGLSRLRSLIKFTESPLYLSFYVSLCPACKMEIQRREKNSSTVSAMLFEEGRTYKQFIQWIYIKMEIKSLDEIFVSLSTIDNNNESNFWAFDDFRVCSNEEIRVAIANTIANVVCQSVAHQSWMFNKSKQTENYLEPPICIEKEDNIGQNCNVLCPSITSEDSCKGYKICAPQEKGSNQGSCACSSRYTWQSNCTELSDFPIKHFDVYSTTNSSIFLRWQTSDANNYEYIIKYHLTDLILENIKLNNSDLTPCNLWFERFSCYELKQLNAYSWYTISITTTIASIYDHITIMAYTSELTSSPPLNLNGKWENKTYLYLSWNHPNITNGLLRKFIIYYESMKENKTEISYTIPNYEYKQRYSYKTDHSLQYSSSYTVRVCAFNIFCGTNATLFIDSPPRTPELTAGITFVDQVKTDSTITITIPEVNISTKSPDSFLYVVVSKMIPTSKKNISEQQNSLKQEILDYSSYGGPWIAKEIVGLHVKQLKVLLGTQKNCQVPTFEGRHRESYSRTIH